MIVHNVPESTLGEAHDRKKEDIQNMTVLFNKYVGVQASVTNAIRIGKPSDRPRLIKVSLSTTEEKLNIFHNRHNLRRKDHPAHVNKLFITPDLTPNQQTRNKQLHSQLAELNKAGNLYVIK